MRDEIDYDPLLASDLAARLSAHSPTRRLAPRRRSSGGRLVVPALVALVLAAAAALSFEINAVAESQGGACLDALAKINLFGRTLAESVHNGTIDDQRGAKDRLFEYAKPLIAANCADEPGLLIKTNNGTNPLPSPSGAVHTAAPYNGPVKGGLKP